MMGVLSLTELAAFGQQQHLPPRQRANVLHMFKTEWEWVVVMRKTCFFALTLIAFAVSQPVFAQALNCDELPELNGNPRHVADGTPDENCLRWDGSTPDLVIYHPVPNATTNADAAERNLNAVKSAVQKSLEVYGAAGFLNNKPQPHIYLRLTRDPPKEATVAAGANSASASSPCVINVYVPSVESISKLQQILAHEVFHCVQIAQLNQPYIPTTYWWMEGSAEWASAIVYPATNNEYASTVHYDQHTLLFDQCDGGRAGRCYLSWGIYATALFFLDMANQQSNADVFDLLQRMPIHSSQSAQFEAFSDAPGIGGVFEIFAHDYIDKKIPDLGGGAVDQPEPIFSTVFEVNGEQDIRIQGTPLTIYAYKINFAKGKAYTITGLQNRDRWRLSYRLGTDNWQSGDSGQPIDINSGCAAQTGIIVVTSAENVPESEQFDLHVSATDEKGDCPCNCISAVPECVMGVWSSTETPTWELVRRLLSPTASTKTGGSFAPGDVEIQINDSMINVSIERNGDFTSDHAVKAHGTGVAGHDTGMRVDFQSKGEATGHACLAADRQLCMQFSSQSFPTAMNVTVQGMTMAMPIPGNKHEGVIAMPYTCGDHALTLKPTLKGEGSVPTTELPMHFNK